MPPLLRRLIQKTNTLVHPAASIPTGFLRARCLSNPNLPPGAHRGPAPRPMHPGSCGSAGRVPAVPGTRLPAGCHGSSALAMGSTRGWDGGRWGLQAPRFSGIGAPRCGILNCAKTRGSRTQLRWHHISELVFWPG